MIIERLKSGVITVGHGRGFVVEGAGERLVITAAHCLPSLPPALPSFGLEARTYGPLLARRGALRGNGFLHENGKTCTKMAKPARKWHCPASIRRLLSMALST